jgi:hypothetical protein
LNDEDRIEHLADLEKLSTTLSDRDGGELFQRDLEEARVMAARDPRFAVLVEGLSAGSLGERMAAVTRFFDGLPAGELATLELPMHLAQLRRIYLSSQ